MLGELTRESVSPDEVVQFGEFVSSLPDDSRLARALRAIKDALDQGQGVLVAETEARMTPNQAARFLHMSRAHLNKLIDANELPHEIVGHRDRRIRVSDVLAFEARQQGARKALAERFAHSDRDDAALIEEMLAEA